MKARAAPGAALSPCRVSRDQAASPLKGTIKQGMGGRRNKTLPRIAALAPRYWGRGVAARGRRPAQDLLASRVSRSRSILSFMASSR